MTISELIRRDPQKGKKEFSTRNGFTIIELMVVLAVIAIITSFALPSYRTLIEKRQVTSGAQQIQAFLSAARMEAIKRNEKVTLSSKTGTSWCLGYTSYDANADDDQMCDCSIASPTTASACSIDSFQSGAKDQLRVFNSVILDKPVEISAISYGGTDSQLVFDPVRGMLVQDDIRPMPFEMQLTSPDDSYALNIQVLPSGRVTICSDDDRADQHVPGYESCL